MNINFDEILDSMVSKITEIPTSKKYWLIRTQSGSLYETFIDNNFVGLDHREVSLKQLSNSKELFRDNHSHFQDSIKTAVLKYYISDDREDIEISPQKVGLIAGQIFRFYEQVKAGDIVIIPSSNSDVVSFGLVTENNIASFTDEESRRFDTTTQFLNKRVKWISEISRRSLDPNIFRMFTAHHAITDVSKYADVIERSLHDFFILDNDAHLIINVQTADEIKAKDLFGLGYNFLEIFDDIAAELKIDGVSSNDLEVKVNLNSPGKIDLKSSIKKTTVLAGIILLVCGGGYVASDGSSIKTDGIKSLIEAISDYRDRQEDRNLKMEIFNKYKDSMQVKTPDDMIKLMKQVDDNQDLAK